MVSLTWENNLINNEVGVQRAVALHQGMRYSTSLEKRECRGQQPSAGVWGVPTSLYMGGEGQGRGEIFKYLTKTVKCTTALAV
jgi:hypothetical protein